MPAIKNIETALNLFQQSASQQAEATEQGDYKTANKCYNEIIAVYKFLQQNNSVQSLHESLSSSSVGIRLWAAAFLLPTHEKESILVLKKIANSPGIHSLTAKTTIREWEKGNLKFN